MNAYIRPERHEALPQPLSIQTALLAVHRREVLGWLAEVGFKVGTFWDQAAIAKLGENEAERALLGRLDPSIRYEDTYHAADILGFSEFKLRWSNTPPCFAESGLMRPHGQRTGEDIILEAEAPLKYVDVRLRKPAMVLNETDAQWSYVSEDARIFVVQDTPIVALFTEDLESAADELEELGKEVEDDDPGLVSYLSPAPGENPTVPMHYLDEAVCFALASAIMEAKVISIFAKTAEDF